MNLSNVKPTQSSPSKIVLRRGLLGALPCLLGVAGGILSLGGVALARERPNIILVMADDQGWGQMGYYDHPVLKTPNLDAMAKNGLRFDRFYAGAPNCSPTRATVLTGRSNDRAGVHNHGYALRRQERTLPQALQKAGYVTAHFGKWHLNGYSGPGVPILASDKHRPGNFGFDEWLSVTNFFDRDPVMSRMGEFEQMKGDSSEIIVAEALKFIGAKAEGEAPFLAVIWYGSPHSPWQANEGDRESFAKLKDASQHHYGELVAMDRSIGALRSGLRELGIADNTLLWFCSDNGGLPRIEPATVGGLRGFKGSVYEGGLRVPCVIEWPAVITTPRTTDYPAVTMDIFPTIAEVVGLPDSAIQEPVDGTSLRALFEKDLGPRENPIPFRHTNRAAWVDNDYKLVVPKVGGDVFELYNLVEDPHETSDLFAKEPGIAARLKGQFLVWNASVERSLAGEDYPEGRVLPGDPHSRRWTETPEYKPFIEQWLTPAQKKAIGGRGRKKPGRKGRGGKTGPSPTK